MTMPRPNWLRVTHGRALAAAHASTAPNQETEEALDSESISNEPRSESEHWRDSLSPRDAETIYPEEVAENTLFQAMIEWMIPD
ncbi:MAG TPA: hypothetical protein VG937_11360 [Polyangiaceae bacterium]|nr:hypothetical protein [Polyangiaceae bacterium]